MWPDAPHTGRTGAVVTRNHLATAFTINLAPTPKSQAGLRNFTVHLLSSALRAITSDCLIWLYLDIAMFLFIAKLGADVAWVWS
jgi:hypothetical protein